MFRTLTLCAAVAIAPLAVTSPVLAGGKHHDDHRVARGGDDGFCPPGLAKKHNGCQPPGQAKKEVERRDHDDDHYRTVRVGDRIGDTYVLIQDPRQYGWDPAYTYYRAQDRVVRVDPDTQRVMAIIGLVDALLN